MQAWKIVIPVTKNVPEMRVHEGYEWLYVIAGKMRLILGNHDLILGPGEVAEFDTKEPHWFGSNGTNRPRSSASSAATANGCSTAQRPTQDAPELTE